MHEVRQLCGWTARHSHACIYYLEGYSSVVIFFQVDGVNLENKTNLEAVEVLKKTGSVVRMKLARPKDAGIPKRNRSSGKIGLPGRKHIPKHSVYKVEI